MELKIEYLPLSYLKPYVNNAKLHPAEQIEQIKRSIEEFGFDDPIAIWKDSTVIEGHGRLIAASEMGLETVPVIRLDHLTDEQRRAYTLVHNKLTMNSGYDPDLLEQELEGIQSLDMSEYGFDLEFDEDFEPTDNTYTQKAKIPQYEVEGDTVLIDDLCDCEKYRELFKEIDNSGVSENEKRFLRLAATRHIVFDYRNIAEYYAKANTEMQELMENSALVIIDIADAIADGYAVLSKRIRDLKDES